MRWRGRRQSSNVEDRRGRGGFGSGLGKGGLSFPRGGGSGGIGGRGLIGLVAIVAVLWLLGVNPVDLLQGTLSPDRQTAGTRLPETSAQNQASAPEDELKQFVSVVLADTEDVWHELFRASGETYSEPTLVLFSDQVRSACGFAGAAMGPFYCPGDSTVYLDLGFFRELRERFEAPGDFAQAYVIAHEVGHHVQNLVGILPKYNELRQTLSEREANALSVRLELQADCFAGVFAYFERQRGVLEEGDVAEALGAAAAVGDDAIQRRTQGQVVPDAFNHGSSADRQAWFQAGFETGDVTRCDTFSRDDP
ncbi:KPN_02809 family neutral zinc metallopeptidase [Amorphus orientalis]|uniref:Metalloprotease n=1 Tax=Amorphus orientalis TaxID=649198 RepID=A0AAE4AQH2_9HYPH|nr:neutral zinc metallopeptidase [Amorphus orientalis]MDQ0314081.1 putative metalloprotease [Amorphus orientalis]